MWVRKYSLFTFLVFVMTNVCSAATQSRDVVWADKPIKLTLPVNEFIVIHLPKGDMAAGIPSSIQGMVDQYAVGNTVHLRANQEFGETLIPIRNVDSNQQYIFMLSAENEASAYDIRVIDQSSVDNNPIPGKKIDIRKALVQHASQTLYAPARLAPNNPRIRTAPLQQLPVYAKTIKHGVCGNFKELMAKPIAAWRTGSHFITAVKVENVSDQNLSIDPRGCHIPGDFEAMSFQHGNLEAKYKDPCTDGVTKNCNTQRTYKEVTTLYYISTIPFWEAANVSTP